MTFENGVKATLIMMPFTAEGGRILKFFGALGEIVLHEEEDYLAVKPFGKEAERIPLKPMTERGYAHGGGDAVMIDSLYAFLSGESEGATTLEASVESHLMGLCAEESRVKGGELIYVHGKQ